MKWFVPITAATCAAALVVMLPLALAGTSSPTRGEDTLDGPPTLCVGEPSWFAPIHKAYDCNPRITPDFDFASLYSPDVNRLEATFTESAASVTNRIGDLQTLQLINTGGGTVSGFGTATVVVGITQDRSVTPCGPGSWTNAATRRIVLDEGVLIVREASIACPTASGPVINGHV